MTVARCRRAEKARRAFTLIELLITLAVVAVLIGLLTPALSSARETAQRLTCATNQHNLAGGLALYSRDHKDRIPTSYFGDPMVRKPQEMMATTVGPLEAVGDRWEGLGTLSSNAGGYVDCDKCFFCPSHHGQHHVDTYSDGFWTGGARCYANYHYRGDIDFKTRRRMRIDEPWTTVFLTDGLRTQSDFNHGHGGNRVHGDLSISWWDDRRDFVSSSLPPSEISVYDQVKLYPTIWQSIEP